MLRKIILPLAMVVALSACAKTQPEPVEPPEPTPSAPVEVAPTPTPAPPEIDNPFENLYYYEAENQSRYEAYQQQTGYSDDEVVWRVNMNIDRVPYEEPEQIKNTDELTLIVNKRFQLPEDYVPENLVQMPSQRYMDADAKTAYNSLVAAAYWEGYCLWECSSYRSIQYQIWLYNRYLQTDTQERVDEYSSRPCFSEHHTGRAIDLMTNGIDYLSQFVGTPEAQWVEDNAYRFGFIVRYNENNEDVTGYTPEPWHIYYVGTLHALMMHELGFQSFEEYVAKYIEYTPEGFQFPEAPELPEIPAIPAPVIPVEPEVPEVPEVPEIEEPVDPETSEVPETQEPVDPGTPKVPETQEPVDPETSEVPETQEPVDPETPEVPETEEPVNPETTENVEIPSVDVPISPETVG